MRTYCSSCSTTSGTPPGINTVGVDVAIVLNCDHNVLATKAVITGDVVRVN